MAGGSDGCRVALVMRHLTPGLISSSPGTAGLPPFIVFSTVSGRLLFGLQRAFTFSAFDLGALGLNRSVAFGLLGRFSLTGFLLRSFDLTGSLVALRSAARAARAVNRSANAGSAALARNFSNATFLALAAASCRSMKSGCLKPAIYFRPRIQSCTGCRGSADLAASSSQRTRQPRTVASIGLLVSTLCQAPLLHRHKNGMT
jgi:hypothetical protein